MAVTHGSGLGGGSSISGAGAPNRITLWTGVSSLGSDAGLIWGGASPNAYIGINQLRVDTTGDALYADVTQVNLNAGIYLSWTDGTAIGGTRLACLSRPADGIIRVGGQPQTLGHLYAGIVSVEHPAPVAAVVTPSEAADGTITTIAMATLSTSVITCVAAALINDTETLTVTDASGAVIYEFEKGGGVTPGNIAVDISGATDADSVAAILGPIIDANNTDVAVTVVGPQVQLVATTPGVAGSITTADTVGAGGFGTVDVAGVDGILDGETFTIVVNGMSALVYEFDTDSIIVSPIAVPVNYGDSADDVRDAIILAVNGVAVSATNGGAATVNLELVNPAEPGGVNTETVVAGGFAITGMTKGGASTWGYTIVAKMNDGSTVIGTETQTLTGPDDLDANDYNTITWVDNIEAALYDIYRTTVAGPPSALTTGLIAFNVGTGVQTFDDTGIAAGAALPTEDTSGQVRFYDSGGNYVGIRASESLVANQNLILPTTLPAVGETLVAATVSGTQVQLDWTSPVTYYTKTLTGGVNTDFLDVTVADDTVTSGQVIYEVQAVNDAGPPPDYNVVCGMMSFTAINQGGVTMYSDPTDRQDSNVESNATVLTVTYGITNTIASDKITLYCNASSTLAGTKTYTLRYQVVASKALTVAAV